MATRRFPWAKALLGCLAAAGIAWAGLSILRQLSPPAAPGAQTAEALPKKGAGPWQERQQRLLAKVEGPAKRVAGPEAKIVPAHLVWQAAGGRGDLVEDIEGCLPAGAGIDVLWSRGQLYLMKKKGRLDLIFTADSNGKFRSSDAGSTNVCFDGRYVWGALWRDGKTPLLVVLDPQSGQSWTLGVGDGLPIGDDPRFQPNAFVIGPVAPGKVCIAARSGPGQLALVEFDPKAGAKFETLPIDKVIPADGSAPQNLEYLKWQTGEAFRPVAIFNLAPPGDARSQRIAVCCSSSRSVFSGPLLIDPQTRSIEAAASDATSMQINNSRLISVAGSMYWTEQTSGEPPKSALVRARAPKLDEEYMFDGIPAGHPVAYNDRIAFLGDECWLWKPGERQIESLDVQVPWLYQPFGKPESLPPPRKIAGEEWELTEVFASQHYGALVKAYKFVRPNLRVSTYRFFQFALADDPRLDSPAPSPPAADRPQLAVKLAPGTAASELRAYSAAGDDQRPLAGFGKVVEAAPDDKLRYPILAREIARQALLIAARDQLQWTTRDETLSENHAPTEEKPAATWVLTTRFPYGGKAELALHRIEGEGKASDVWKEQLALSADESHPLDYAALVQSAERWSRETFPGLLKQGELRGEPNPASDDAKISPAAAEWLNQMTFTAQFAVVRELHHAIRKQGESAALLGDLSRAYANLGVLSEFHWNAMHKVCKARALLYAERLTARDPQSARALWHRAYAKALTGLFDSAVADLDTAAKLAAADGAAEPPEWLAVLEAYCRFDADKLAKAAEDDECAQLAALLQFFQVEGLKESTIVQTMAQRQMQENPECFRLFDAMCDCCAINTQHVATQMAPAVLAQTTPLRLERLSGLPPDASELLKRASMREVALTEIADSLLQTAAEDDREEFSWRILGRMVQEVEFVQLWRRASFMRYQWSVPTDDFIAAIADMATSHRYRALIDLCSSDARRWQAATETLIGCLELEELDYPQFLAFSKGLGDAWKTRWTEQYAEAERRPAMHLDDVHRDLLVSIEQEGFGSPEMLSERLMRVSSASPDAVAANARQHNQISPDELAALEQKFPRQPQVLKLLAQVQAEPKVHARRLREYIKVSPDAWAYQMLAGIYYRQGDMDQWKAVLDESLEQPAFGLEHARIRVDIADYFMDKGEWEQARPYAEQAAESWAEWAMICAIKCYRGLGHDEQEGLWQSRIVERYPCTEYWLDYYVWARRAGSRDAKRILQIVDPIVTKDAPRFGDPSQYYFGLFYQLSKRPKEALAAYRKGAFGRQSQDARGICFDSLWMAIVASELGDAESRDQALERIAKQSDPGVASPRRLAEWLQACWRLNKEQQPDLDAARQIAAAAEVKDRTGINCLIGRALDLRGEFDAALEFYQAAVVAAPARRTGAMYSFVCATLRDHGIEPGKGATKIEPEAKNHPAKETDKSK